MDGHKERNFFEVTHTRLCFKLQTHFLIMSYTTYMNHNIWGTHCAVPCTALKGI